MNNSWKCIHPWIWILSGFWVRIIIPVRGEWWAVHRPADKPPSLLSPVVGSPATLWSPRPALSSVRYHNTLFIPGRPDVKFITSPSTNIKSEIWIIDSLPKTYEMRSNAGIVMTRSKRQKFAYQGIRSGTQNIFYCERESWHRYHCLTMSLPFKYLNHKIEVFIVLSLLHKHPYQDRRTL